MFDETKVAMEIEALEQAALSLRARHQFIENFTYPDGIKLAVNFTCDFDAMLLRRVLNEPPMQMARGEFGGRVGIWRLIELFNSHDIKATIFTPGRICELYPDALIAAANSGHEIADHMWEHHVPKDPEVEHEHLRKSIRALEQTVGYRPVGSRSWHNLDLLVEEGCIYVSHGSAHHLPHYVREQDGAGWLLNIPFHYAIDDAMYFSFAWLASENAAQRVTDPDRVLELWWKAFLHQYKNGGYLNVCLHPFVSGRALRIAMLDELITRMKKLPGVWFPSSAELARHCLDRHPPQPS
jgi:peptidoglycan/xylan/chitin deacetylase (PgdA/CDA1 family)